jgi:hypothetical protein
MLKLQGPVCHACRPGRCTSGVPATVSIGKPQLLQHKHALPQHMRHCGQQSLMQNQHRSARAVACGGLPKLQLQLSVQSCLPIKQNTCLKHTGAASDSSSANNLSSTPSPGSPAQPASGNATGFAWLAERVKEVSGRHTARMPCT